MASLISLAWCIYTFSTHKITVPFTGCAHKIPKDLASWLQLLVQTVFFRIKSTVHALGTLSLFHTNVFLLSWHTFVVRTNCGLHLAHNIFWKNNGLLDSQSYEGCHQHFVELPGEIKIWQILLVHFVIEGSGFGSHCMEEIEVVIQCPSLHSRPHQSTKWHKIHHINASLHVIMVDQRLRFLPLVFWYTHHEHCCQSQHNLCSSLLLMCIGNQGHFVIVASLHWFWFTCTTIFRSSFFHFHWYSLPMELQGSSDCDVLLQTPFLNRHWGEIAIGRNIPSLTQSFPPVSIAVFTEYSIYLSVLVTYDLSCIPVGFQAYGSNI